MSRIGNRQSVAANKTIGTTETFLGYMTGIVGAIGVKLRFSGGDNSTNGLASVRAQSIDGGGDPTKSTGGQSWLADPDLADLSLPAIKTNQVPPDGGFVYLTAAGLSLVGLPKLAIYATMSTAQSVGVEVDAWPIFPDAGSVSAGLAALPG